jgi:phosphoserine aminotransferase
MSRLINFCSVPSALPLPFLDRTSAALQDFQGSKISVMENSLLDRLIEFMCEFEGVSA